MGVKRGRRRVGGVVITCGSRARREGSLRSRACAVGPGIGFRAQRSVHPYIRFRELNASWQEAEGEERKWEARANAFALAKNLCKSRLEAAHCAYQLGAFENLGPIRRGSQLAH